LKLLLDTCTFLWIILDNPQLSSRARELFADPANDVYLSVVSTWEIALKHALGRLPLPDSLDPFIPTQRRRHWIESLALEEGATLHLPKIPDLHRDPFDRMLVSQALVHGLVILTPDSLIAQYPVLTEW
jgi:PIN domain nuclease of toxin-antitoxin system